MVAGTHPLQSMSVRRRSDRWTSHQKTLSGANGPDWSTLTILVLVTILIDRLRVWFSNDMEVLPLGTESVSHMGRVSEIDG